MAKKKTKKAAKPTATAAAEEEDAPVATVILGADWVATLREVLQDVQTLALERTTYQQEQYHQQQQLHAASLAPALRRLRRVFKDEVGFGSRLVEENWVLFRDEIWLAIARVLVAPKVSSAVVYAFGAFFGEFLCAFAPRDDANKERGSSIKKKRNDTPNTKQKRDQESSLNEMRIEILNRLMEATKAEDKNVRLRVCHFLQIILNKLDYIEEDLFDKLRATLIPRANDKLGSIRVQSVYALKRIQEPEDHKDPVTAELLRLMVSDPSKDVRKAAVHSVAITKAAYKDLIIRIRDTSEEVRHAVFKVFGDQMSIRDIPISDRAHLLDQGLQDRSEMVRTACEQMVLKKWLPICRGSPVTLLKALDIEQFPAIGSKVSRIILKHVSENPRLEDVVPHNALEILAQNSEACDAESIFFWREQCYYYQKVDRDHDKVAALLPNISDFCKLVVVACEAGGEMFFIAQQLLELGHLLDFQDEFGRRRLLDCLQKMLRNVDTETPLISSIMELMACIHSGSSDQEFIQVVAEITSDLYDPLEEDEEKSEEEKAKSSLNNLSPEERDAASNRFEELESLLETLDMDSQEYSDVQNEMIELEKLLQDPEVLRRLRCLEVVAQLLKLTASTLRDPTIAGMGRYILPAIESDVPAVREAGMEGLGLFCLLDKTFAEKHMLVFWRALNNEEEERDVKLNCIKALFDMLFSFANLQPRSMVPIKAEPEVMGDGDGDGDGEGSQPETVRLDALDLDMVLFGLAELLLVDDLDVQSTIVEGFGKLFLLNRIKNVAVLAQLLETYFSPRLQNVQLMSEHGFQSKSLQLLSIFFPAFVRSSTLNCALLEEASIHLIQKMMEKEDFGDSSSTIDLAACMKYVCHLLSHYEPQTKTDDSKSDGKDTKSKNSCAHHNRVGLNICMDILALEHIASLDVKIDEDLIVSRQKVLVKALLLTDVSTAEPRSAALFQALLADVASKCFVAQRGLVRSAETFYKRTMASYKEKGGEVNEDVTVLEQDQEWAKQHVVERAQTLESALLEATKKEAQRRLQKQRLAKKKRRAGKFSSSESDMSSDEEGSADEDDDDEGEDKPAPPRREVSTRKSKQVAAERITNREFDVKMKIAFESDEDEDEEDDEEDDESDEESSAEDA